MSNIGILGGTFDPIHNGHISLATDATIQCDLEKLIFLPAKVQPFKIGKKIADVEDRVNMLSLVTNTNSKFAVSRVEVDDNSVSYTYNTLVKFREVYPNDKIFFITGTDSFIAIEKWYCGIPLLTEFSFIVGSRPGYKEKELSKKIDHYTSNYGTMIIKIDNKIQDISSTEIKYNIKNGISISNMIPSSIERYINEHRLYK